MNRLVPSLDLSWDSRDGTRLTYPKVVGKPGRARALQRFSIKWEGFRLYNSIPVYLIKWSSTQETFNNLLDKYLENIPDQPEVNNMKPDRHTLTGEP